jgi:hypothetical protein
MVPEARPDIDCVVHDTALPLPEELTQFPWDLIVLGPTFLCARYDTARFANVVRDFEWVRDSKACKVALPQDDYDCSAVLDNWMLDWSVDYIYTVCPDNWEVLYPKSSRHAEIRLGYTGYISDAWLRTWENPKSIDERLIDVSYRATKLPANFGRIGQLKSDIAQNFLDRFPESGNREFDISTDPRATIPGVAWHSFMEDSKFCLVTPSGSSILDPWNKIRKCVQIFTALQPDAAFGAIEKHCFPGIDGENVFTAVSPRNIEAALAQTVQLAVVNSYSGLLEPYEHYIPLDPDCSNIDEVLSAMDDRQLVERLRNQAKEAILSAERLRTKAIVNEIVSLAGMSSTKIGAVGLPRKDFERIKNVHDEKVMSVSEDFWRYRRKRRQVKDVLVKLGARRVRDVMRIFIR